MLTMPHGYRQHLCFPHTWYLAASLARPALLRFDLRADTARNPPSGSPLGQAVLGYGRFDRPAYPRTLWPRQPNLRPRALLLKHPSISRRAPVLAVEPLHGLERLLRRAPAQHHVAQLTRDATRVIELAVNAHHDLHAPGAQIARRLIGLERRSELALQLLDLVGEADCVLDRHTGALRQILQHRVGGVAEQRDAAAAPFLDRWTVAQNPHAPALDLAQEQAHRRAGHGEAFVQLGRIAKAVPALLVAGGMEHGDQIVELATAQRIDHEMHLLAGPERHRPAPQRLWHLGGRQHRPIGDMARHLRLAVADHDLADGRPQSVGADQRRIRIAAPVLRPRRHAFTGLLDSDDLLRGVQTNEIDLAAGVEQHIQEIGAVDQGIGMLELGAKALA